VVIFDFGPGGGTAIRSEKSVWLLDCGSVWDFQNTLTPWLRQAGRAMPDGIVFTHGDADHIAGAMELIPHESPHLIIDSPASDRSPSRKKIHGALAAAGLPKSIHRADDSIGIGKSARLHFLHPPAGHTGRISDDKVLVARLDISGTCILFLSDAGPSTTDWLLKNHPKEIPADILAVGRHESGILPDGGFIMAVGPKLVVASSAEFPNNQPIPPEWAEMVASLGIELFRQDETGAVTIQPSPDGFSARGFVNNEIFSSQQRPR
jgi:competence protein ComEC